LVFEPTYKLVFDDKVIKDLKSIDKVWQQRIIKAIKTKLVQESFQGKRLVGDLSPYYRFRVSDYRVVYEVLEQEVLVAVIRIRHRKAIYR
jgi:mRNA interferase RelE/StbE